MKLGLVVGALGLMSCGIGGLMSRQELQTIFPKNDMRIPIGLESTGGLTEQEFNDAIDVAKEIFEPIAKDNNETLEIDNDWANAEVNAAMTRYYGGGVKVFMYGGLARHRLVKVESFSLVISHELSHAYCWKYTSGKLKTVYIDSGRKICSESNADYQGNGDINNQIIKGLMNKGYQFDTTTDEFKDKKCAEKWERGSEDFNMCIIRLNAGNDLANLLAELMEEPEPNYETPDTTVVTRTNVSYPKTVQCRLDNYFAGVFKLNYSKCWFKN